MISAVDQRRVDLERQLGKLGIQQKHVDFESKLGNMVSTVEQNI